MGSKAVQVSGTMPGWLATVPHLRGTLSPLATFCSGEVADQGVPHLPPGSQLDEGADGLVGAGPAGEHVAPVEGLEEADEVGTLGLLEGRGLLVG